MSTSSSRTSVAPNSSIAVVANLSIAIDIRLYLATATQ